MGRFTSSRWLSHALVPALPLLYCTPAAAQSATEANSGAALADIVVTAQKTATNLQRTPIAITALSPADLQRADIRSVIDLDKQVPGLAIMAGGGFPLNVTIRGVGYDGLQNNSAQPGVAFVENGVYVASPLNLSSSFLDLAQIEVLRGPQGTVNGQNADGGALNITTGLPALDAFHVDAEASLGSYYYNRLRTVANIPVSDTVAVRIAAQHEGHDGWLKAPNQPYTKHIGDEDTWSGRASVLWKPTDRFSFTLWGEYFDRDSKGLGVRNPLDPIGDVRATSNEFPTPQKTRSRIVAGTLAYDLDFATLKAISSYQYVRADGANSGDLLLRPYALDLYGIKDEETPYIRSAKSYTEEINLAGTSGRLDWIVGGFFLRTNEKQFVFLTQQSSPVRIPYTVNFNPTPAELGALFGAGLGFESVANAQRTSYAGYGQATWRITDALRLTGGVRYSWDKYTSNTSVFFAPFVPLESKFTKVTGKGVLEYDIAPHATVYASFSTGVKPGGTNLNPGALVIPESFSHEFVRAYELGLKSELFDRKLRLNLSGYYNDYRNLQTDSEDVLPFDGGITNVPKSHIYGLEAEATLLLPDGFRLTANGAYMKSRIDSHFLMLDPQVAFAIDRRTGRFLGTNIPERFGAFADVHGNELARVPRFSASGTISKTTPVADGKLDLYVQANYRSSFQARIYNAPPLDRVGSQFTMNANAHYEPDNGPWYVEIQVTNLTASHDVASRFPDNFGTGAAYDYIVPPRQFIGRIGVKF
jgi:iron complex outermembrane receptor protein